MKPVLVVYGTRQGHTRRVAEHVAETVIARGIPAELLDAAHVPGELPLDAYSAVIVCASVHGGKHESEVMEFVRKHREQLERMPTAFLSVSLSEAGAEDDDAQPAQRAKAAEDVARMIEDFLNATGWHPTRIKAVAGALLYTKYNFLVRFIMKRIAGQAGGDTATSQDFEYTHWTDVNQFVDEVIGLIPAS